MDTLTVVVVVIVVVALAAFFVVGFNKLRTQNVAVDEALGGIDVQLTRRADLIPNLVNTVKGYATHERAVFDEVTEARAGIVRAQDGSVVERAAAEARLDKAIMNVMAVAEAYPELKASVNFLELQKSLKETEDQLAFARQYYNDAAARLNTSVKTIPWMFFRGVAGVHEADFYDAPPTAEAPPTVNF